MKTNIVTLQGQDFVVSKAAEPLLVAHLKDLQKATRWHPSLYHQNVEGLRDVLLTSKAKTVSKATLMEAIELVGLPDDSQADETFGSRFPRISKWMGTLRSSLQGMPKRLPLGWRYRIWSGVVAVTIFLGAIAVFSGVGSLFGGMHQSDGWQTIQTSIGPVRSWVEAHPTKEEWPFGWQASFAYVVLLLVVAFAAARLRRGTRMPIYGLIACTALFMLFALWQMQRASTLPPAASQVITATKALHPRVAYLQQCGDEIPYVFDNETNGMLFRQLRDQGFQLGTPIQTRMSDGTIDTTQLCSAYDELRRDHPKQNVVLQMYTTTADGTLRPYDFGDIQNQTVSSNYGLFVKS